MFPKKPLHFAHGHLLKLRKTPGLSDILHQSRKSQLAAKKFDLKYKSFEDWCTRNAGSLPKASAETADERSLAHWLKNKLSSCRQGKLPDDQLAKLKKIPGLSDFPQVSQESQKCAAEFDDACKRLEDWSATHHGMPPSNKKKSLSPEEMSMAVWLKNKLAFHKRRALPGDQLCKLKRIAQFSNKEIVPLIESNRTCVLHKLVNFESRDEDDTFLKKSHREDLRCKSFQDWCATHGGTLPRRNGESAEERSLANWFKNKLYDYKRDKLPDEQMAKLKELPHFLERSLSRSQEFDRVCTRLTDWCHLHHSELPNQKGCKGGTEERSLASWLKSKLYNYRRGKLPDDQLVKIRKIPCLSDFPHLQGSQMLAQKFDRDCRSIKEWCDTHEGLAPRSDGETKEERALAAWLKNKLYRYRCGKLPKEQVAELKTLPGFLERSQNRSQKFDLVCASFQEWCASHNGALPTCHAEAEEERSLAIWLKNRLKDFRHGKLSDQQLAKLRKIPSLLDFPQVSRRSQVSAQKFD